mgnify:FL=1
MNKSITQLVYEAHQNAKSKGWWDEDRSFGEIIALIHSEASEALEDYRAGHLPTNMWYEKKIPGYGPGPMVENVQLSPEWKPCGIPSELADIVIRVFDVCGRYGIDLEKAITEKMAYNATRPQRHGGKVI